MTYLRGSQWSHPNNTACYRQLRVVTVGAMCSSGFQLRPNNTLLDNQIGDKLQDKPAAWESGRLPKKPPPVIWLLSLLANALLASGGIRSGWGIVWLLVTRLLYTPSDWTLQSPRKERRHVKWPVVTLHKSAMINPAGSVFTNLSSTRNEKKVTCLCFYLA